MSVGVIIVQAKIYLECDIEDDEAKKSVEAIEEHLEGSPIEGVYVSHVKIKDHTDYDGVPVSDLNHPEQNGQ